MKVGDKVIGRSQEGRLTPGTIRHIYPEKGKTVIRGPRGDVTFLTARILPQTSELLEEWARQEDERDQVAIDRRNAERKIEHQEYEKKRRRALEESE